MTNQPSRGSSSQRLPGGRGRGWACAAAGVALLAAPVRGQAPQPPKAPQAEKIGDDLYRIGKVKVDLKSKTLTCAGKINMPKGVVEYLAVAPGGKTHESILRLDVQPMHLQVGLILLGLEPKGGLQVQGDQRIPKGSPVDMWIEWKRAGKTVKVRAEEAVWDVTKRRPMDPRPWVFSGSLVTRNGFLADEELSLIATYRDPAAIVNNVLPTGSDDSIYKANERILPPRETPVLFTISPAAP